mmetsp:Transcript_35385/g.63108  ORF Transcript_35385/g.63108 Transcript_35385/m.63108 type:complete len:234 (-) Transcript_35385:768-1469(-)
MVLHRGLATAVIAQDVLCAACVLGGEPLRGYQRVEHLKVHAHVAHGLGADWASVVVAGVCLETAGVHEVTARQLFDRHWRVKEVLVAHCAVSLQTLLPADVLFEEGEAHAGIALHAVEKIDAESLTSPANIAGRAVVDVTSFLVVKEMTDRAVVSSHRLVAMRTRATDRLPLVTEVAHHLLDLAAVHLVIVLLVMTQSTGIYFSTAGRYQGAFAFVVPASVGARGNWRVAGLT